MAPSRVSPKRPEIASTPLADFFWIAGVDSSDLLKTYAQLSRATLPKSPGGLEDTIEEDQDAEQSSVLESPRPISRSSTSDPWNRFSKISNGSSRQLKPLNGDTTGTASNRSSATIRPIQSDAPTAVDLMDDVDFENALRSFAADRESFLFDLNLSAGAITQSNRTTRQRPKTLKIKGDDTTAPTGLKSSLGSVRRHMSFRDMNSIKRQSTIGRNGKIKSTTFQRRNGWLTYIQSR